MKAFKTMLKIEWKLSLRGMDMFIFAICMPLIVLVILGLLYGSNPAFPGADYSFLDQSFGALVSISICAGGVMGLPLVISEYRSRHILKRLYVTPVSPVLIILVQVTIYMIYALLSFISLFLTAIVFFDFQIRGSWLQFFSGWGLVLLSMFSIGILVGGLAKNTKIAGVLASILYFPMLIFSGATLPFEVMPEVMQNLSEVLPLTQGIKLLKAATLDLPQEQMLMPIGILVFMTIVCLWIGIKYFRWE
jgi:ABC-2 type transport system permease protein